MTMASEMRERWVGTWRNELGSLLRVADVATLSMPDGGATEHFPIAGSYQSARGSVSFAQRFPLRGFVTGDQIVFSVSYRHTDDQAADDDHHTLATWAGQILPVDGQEMPQLRTLWHLVPDLRDGDGESQYGWVVAWSGEDRFDRIADDPDVAVPPV